MRFIWIIIIVIIIIIVCVIENRRNQLGDKQIFKCPNTFEIYKLKLPEEPSANYEDANDKILIYNVDEFNKSQIDISQYKYTYKPKILISTRIVKPFKESINIFKHIDKDTMVTDTVEGFLPYFNYANELIGAESKYRILSNIEGLKATSNEEYIYIKLPDII